ncbi:MAG: hypothetical protein P8181_09600 [bacterium]
MAYDLTIRKDASGQWVVQPDGGKAVVKPGDTVVWRIDAAETATARLQFLDDIFEPSPDLDAHLVSVLERGSQLALTLSQNALPDPRVLRRTYGYAVAVTDAGGTSFAIGSNPPPDLDVGG